MSTRTPPWAWASFVSSWRCFQRLDGTLDPKGFSYSATMELGLRHHLWYGFWGAESNSTMAGNAGVSILVGNMPALLHECVHKYIIYIFTCICRTHMYVYILDTYAYVSHWIIGIRICIYLYTNMYIYIFKHGSTEGLYPKAPSSFIDNMWQGNALAWKLPVFS